MNILYNILIAIGCLFLGYLFGSFPTAVWFGKIFYHQDPRDYGSHNAGGTNAGRLWGKKVGLIIIIIDMIKTMFPIWICWVVIFFTPIQTVVATIGTHQIQYYWLAALGCSIGHCWSMFLKFHGGKAVSNFMGTILGTNWFIGFTTGFLYFGILKMKKFVSLASIVCSLFGSGLAWIMGIVVHFNASYQWSMYGPTLIPSFEMAICLTIMAFILIVRHQSNIDRLKKGNENKIKWMK